MIESIEVDEFQRRFRAVLDGVSKNCDSYVLTRDNHPRAVLVPYEEFLHLQKLRERESQILARFDSARERIAERTVRFTEEEVAADIEAARNELAD